ncbi:AI-2E family transporter [Pigmentiphaga aceris]|uniref:AI-2E family transporter n=1 Tax=Pigmentiphaga aceris TaxID=1940612 RepID=A0A5C0AWA5_9BURK|nr:AI-2E family transporter [Pigmentiphaga aceris]QEI05653.1 AI-2E family transporter [Pigmentiphaga aceris]
MPPSSIELPVASTPVGAEPATHASAQPLPVHPVAPRINPRSAALIVLAVLASLFALQSAREFVVPLVIAVIMAYALDPVVTFLARRRIPRVIGSTLVLLALLTSIVGGAYALRGQAQAIVDQMPEVATKISSSLNTLTGGNGSILDKLRRTAAAIEAAAREPEPRRAVVIERPTNHIGDIIVAGSMSVMAFLGQATMVIFLVFFLLLSGNTFKRKFIKVAGHTLSQKKISVHMLDEINRSIQRYMAMLVITNVALALFTWIAFRWIGLENAGTWAVAAGALHMVPYFGPLIVALCTGVAAFVQFGTIVPTLLTMGSSMAIATIIGSVITTWMTGRIARMNPVAVFIVLLLFTWLWGVWGMLLAIPIALIIKAVADHIEALDTVAEFLGE